MGMLAADLGQMPPAPSAEHSDRQPLPLIRWALIFWLMFWFVDVCKDSLAIRLLGGRPNWFIVGDSTVWWGVWALLTPVVISFARWWQPQSRVALFGGHLIAAVLIALVHISSAATLFAIRSPRPFALADIYGRFTGFFSAYVLFNFFIYGLLVTARAALESFWRLRQAQVEGARLAQRVAELEASTSKARLEALQRQLNPHFLFNALNAVSGLARQGQNDRVTAMLARIAYLLRATLENPGAHEVPLQRELEWLAHYVAVERERFPNRLRVTVHAPDDTRRALVPAMVLQPLVENAVRYGIDQTTAPGEVTVTASRDTDTLSLTVEDTGPGFPAPQRALKREGVGLGNTRSRLEQLYDGQSSLTLENGPSGGARVTVRLPYHESPVLRPADRGGAP